MPAGMGNAPWLEVAWRELGVAERPGDGAEPRVVGYYRDAGHGEVVDDGVPWCAAFVGACLERAGARATGSLMARSYANVGRKLSEPQIGAVAVLTRGDDPSLGHVGFVVGWSASHVILLGGNQGDAVSIAVFDRGRIVALRWPDPSDLEAEDRITASPSPSPNARPGPDGPAEPATLFGVALAHVLAMEGGFADDRFDPGGATNFGITIADYAASRGEELTAGTHGRLRAELKAITPEAVEKIYRERYWAASRAADLPPSIALMHFDTAVNQGVGRAARLLQDALGVSVDGTIGPVTLAAAASAEVGRVITRYADLRREHYRGLSHFWRFGRGWLARVDATLAAARRLPPRTAFPPSLSPEPSTETSMTQSTETMTPSIAAPATQPTAPAVPPAKWWGHSMTIWGAAITAAATVLPALAPVLRPVIGIDLTPDVVRQTTADVVQVTQALAGVAGTVMTIVGRLRAASRLEGRSLTIRV